MMIYFCLSVNLMAFIIWQETSQEEHLRLTLHLVSHLFTGLNQAIVLGLLSPCTEVEQAASPSSCITSSPNMDEQQVFSGTTQDWRRVFELLIIYCLT